MFGWRGDPRIAEVAEIDGCRWTARHGLTATLHRSPLQALRWLKLMDAGWEAEAAMAEVRRQAGGRQPTVEGGLVATNVRLRRDQIAWLQGQAEGISATVRALVDQAMGGSD